MKKYIMIIASATLDIVIVVVTKRPATNSHTFLKMNNMNISYNRIENFI